MVVWECFVKTSPRPRRPNSSERHWSGIYPSSFSSSSSFSSFGRSCLHIRLRLMLTDSVGGRGAFCVGDRRFRPGVCLLGKAGLWRNISRVGDGGFTGDVGMNEVEAFSGDTSRRLQLVGIRGNIDFGRGLAGDGVDISVFVGDLASSPDHESSLLSSSLCDACTECNAFCVSSISYSASILLCSLTSNSLSNLLIQALYSSASSSIRR